MDRSDNGKPRSKSPGAKSPAAKSPAAKPNSATRPQGRAPEDAFDLWLQRGLHQLYDSVAAEPIPAELLRLIEADKAQDKG